MLCLVIPHGSVIEHNDPLSMHRTVIKQHCRLMPSYTAPTVPSFTIDPLFSNGLTRECS